MDSNIISLYYLREPLLWFGMRWAYDFFGSDLAVFLALDIIMFGLLYRVFRHVKMPIYAFFLMFIYLPFFTGYENILRQFVALVFLLNATYLSGKSRYGYLLFATLTHNVTALFTPLIARFRFNRSLKIIPFFVLLVIAMSIVSQEKDSIITGFNFGFMFLITLVLFSVVSKRYVLNGSGYFVHILSYSLAIMLAASLVLSSGQVERFGYLIFGLIFPIIVLTLEKIKPTIFVRLCFCSLVFLLLMVFDYFNKFISYL